MQNCTECGKDLANDKMDSGECWDCFSEYEYAMTATEQEVSDEMGEIFG